MRKRLGIIKKKRNKEKKSRKEIHHKYEIFISSNKCEIYSF